MEDDKTVAVIPARGGSKGLPGKNVMDFCGKPLLAWSILQARQTAAVDGVYVSSDDPEILAVATQYGALPIQRPAELATDVASSEVALLHAVAVIAQREGWEPARIVFLQATSPLREPDDIDRAVGKFISERADALFSAAILDDFCVWAREKDGYRGLTFDPAHRGRRQDREPLFLENGSIYVFRPEILRTFNNRIGGVTTIYEMPFWKSYEIDTKDHIEICEYYFRKYLLPRWKPQNLRRDDIRLIVYDFDGVMTDNRVVVTQDGGEAVMVNRADGLGVDHFRKLGIPQLILSTETNPVVRARAAKLKLEVIDACRDKKAALISYCRGQAIDLQQVLYVGNDVNDLEAMEAVGYSVAPADAHPRIRAVATVVLRVAGGAGVVRELVDLLT